MAFALLTSLSALFPMGPGAGALFTFSVPTTVRSIRVVNTTGVARTISLYLNYTALTANLVDLVLPTCALAPYEAVLLDGGPWDFAANSRISGMADLGNAVTIHVTPASI